MYDDALKIILR